MMKVEENDMFYIKLLKKKEFLNREKYLFGISAQSTDDNFPVKVIVDNCMLADYIYPPTFSTFIFVDNNESRQFLNQFVENADKLPMLIGITEPTHSCVLKYRTLIQIGNKKDYSQEKIKGKVTREIDIENIIKEDYDREIYKEFQEFLPELPENNM